MGLGLLCLGLLLAGCSGEDGHSGTETDDAVAEQGGTLAGWLEFHSRQPLFSANAHELQWFMQRLDEQMATGQLPVQTGKPLRSLVQILAEAWKENRLAERGLAAQPVAIWTLREGLPLLQLKLGDGQAFERTLDEAQKLAGTAWDQGLYQDRTFYRQRGPDTELIWLVRDDWLLLAWLPVGQEKAVMERLYSGAGPTPEAVRRSAARKLPEDWRLSGETTGQGWVDFSRMMDDLLQPEGVLQRAWRRVLEIPDQAMEPVCRNDLQQWLDGFPGVWLSQASDTDGNRKARLLWRQGERWHRHFAGVVSPWVVESGPAAMLHLQLGLDVQGWLEGWQAFLQQDAPKPADCAWLMPLHQALERMRSQMERKPLPALVRQLRGIEVLLDFTDPAMTPASARFMLLLEMEQPAMLLNLLSVFEPAFSPDRWPADGRVKPFHAPRLKQGGLGQLPAWLVHDERQLGLSLGDDADTILQQGARRQVSRGAQTLLLLRQDMQRVLGMMRTQARLAPALRLDPRAQERLDRAAETVGDVQLRLDYRPEGWLLELEQKTP